MPNNLNWMGWALRIGVCLTFTGHGILALQGNESWVPFLTYWGFSEDIVPTLMQIIGVLDLLVAASILVYPWPPVVLWACFWGLITALMRPLTGESILEFVERGVNFMAPLALWFWLRAQQKTS